MSRSRDSEGLGGDDFRFLKLFKVVNCEGHITLISVFNWGCKKDLAQSLGDYLKDIGMSHKDFKKYFDKDMREKLKSDPSGKSFDVSLLYACIKHSCKGLAVDGHVDWREGDENKLESVLTTLKNLRNKLVHEKQFPDTAAMEAYLKDVQKCLEQILRLSAKLYGHEHEVDKKVNEMQNNIEKIMEFPLSVTDIKLYQTQLTELREAHKKIVQDLGAPELKENYENLSNVDPASFISGKERLKVNMIYTRLELKKEEEEESKGDTTDYAVEHEDILMLKSKDGKEPLFIIIEGDAGAGKSTLAKLFLAEWAEVSKDCSPTLKDPKDNDHADVSEDSSPGFKGLKDYDLVLFSEFRNKSISSFLSLVTVRLPHTSYKLDDEDLVRSICNLKILIVFDGLDEINEASSALLQDIRDHHLPRSRGMMQMLITTRPNKLPDLPNICENQPKLHLKLTGVKHDKRVEFIQKLHTEMIKEGQSKADTDLLVDYVKHSHARMGEHFRLPLNLTLLTYLWASDSMKIDSVTTATGLYKALQELITSRLISRLQENTGLHFDKKYFETKCNEYLPLLYRLCFDTHASGLVELPEKFSKELKEKCKDLGLPADDMYAAFLVVHREWTASGYQLSLEAPHRSILEYYVACYIFYRICKTRSEDNLQKFAKAEGLTAEEVNSIRDYLKKGEEETASIQSVLKDRLGVHDLTEKELNSFQNVLMHLGGLLHDKDPKLLEQHANDLVTLIRKTNVEGTKSLDMQQKWLDLTTETNCNDLIAKAAAVNLSKDPKLVVRDGHSGAAITIFKYVLPTLPVLIIMQNEVTYIPQLPELLDELSKRDCDVELLLNHHWKYSKYGTSDDLLKKLTQKKCRVSRFAGHLEDLCVLPVDSVDLKLTMTCSEHAQKMCQQLHALDGDRDLEYLGIHVSKDVTAEELTPLPMVKRTRKLCGTLWLSDVNDEDVERAASVVQALLPEDAMYSNIMFPRSCLSKGKCEELLQTLRYKKVKVRQTGSIKVTSHGNLGDAAVLELRRVTKETVGCEFHSVDDSSIW